MVSRTFVLACFLLAGCSGSAQDAKTPAAAIDPVDDTEVELEMEGHSSVPSPVG